MDRISRGFRLVGASWRVVKADKELLVLPIISFVATAIMAALLLAPVVSTVSVSGGGGSISGGGYVLLGVFYFMAAFITIFFNAAIVGAATIRLQGGDPTLKDGLRIARSHIGKIAGWAAISASVGLVIRNLEERSGLFGRIALSIVGAAWSAITFFVIPVLLFEPLGVTESIKRSAHIFKERWGEQFTGNVSIGLALMVVAIPAAVLTALLFSASPALGIVVGVLAFGILMAVGGALSGVFNAALYRYATTGETSGAFTENDLNGAFAPRRSRGLLGR